jgi:hypothetical protein
MDVFKMGVLHSTHSRRVLMKTGPLMEAIQDFKCFALEECRTLGKIKLTNEQLKDKAWYLKVGNNRGLDPLDLLLCGTPKNQPALHWTFHMLEVNFDYHKVGKRYQWKQCTGVGLEVAIGNLLGALHSLARLNQCSRLRAAASGEAPPPLPPGHPLGRTSDLLEEPVVVWLTPAWPPPRPGARRPAMAGASGNPRSVRPRHSPRWPPPPPPPPLATELPPQWQSSSWTWPPHQWQPAPPW